MLRFNNISIPLRTPLILKTSQRRNGVVLAQQTNVPTTLTNFTISDEALISRGFNLHRTKRLVAFARATGDGVFNAIIWDVVVDPSFEGIGLGKAVMERLVTVLLEKGITDTTLHSEPRVWGFYRPLGFVWDLDGIRGMVYFTKQQKKR